VDTRTAARALDSAVVHNVGAETVAGSKTFTGAVTAVQPAADSTAAIIIKDSGGTNTVMSVDTSNRRVAINGVSPTSKLHVFGPIATAITSKNGAYSVGVTDSTILADASTAGFTVTLPSAVGSTGRMYTVKKTDSSANAVTVGTTSGQMIDGATTRALNAQFKAVTIQSDGANWQVIASV
jgi:hypothetical protein